MDDRKRHWEKREKPLSTFDELLVEYGIEFEDLKPGEEPKPLMITLSDGSTIPLEEVTFEQMMEGIF